MKKGEKQKGFTLIESMIAIALIVVGITGVLTLVNRSLGFSVVALNRLVASNLGQEGIELVRNIRDNNWINGKDWIRGIEGNCEGVFQIDYINGLTCYDDSPILFDENIGYNHLEGQLSLYKRRIEITEINSNEILVKAIVSWRVKGGDFDIIIEDHLFDWR